MDFSPHFPAFQEKFRAQANQTVSTVLVSDLETPVSAALKLVGQQPYGFLLESMEGGVTRGRYSFIGREPDLIWRCDGGKVSLNRRALKAPQQFEEVKEQPIDSLRALLKECLILDKDQPQPMAAGLFGYLGYDMVRYMERLNMPSAPGIGAPEALLIRPTLLAIFDQVENKITLVTPVWFDEAVSAEETYKNARDRLQRALADLKADAPKVSQEKRARAPAHLTAHTSQERYCAMVKKAKEYISAGDIFQVVLSQRFSQPFHLPPFALYRAIRRLDPSPFLFFFNFADFSVVGSSPEILVRVRDGKVTLRPIAGTRPRRLNNRSDEDLSQELLTDPKELSEHLMLLDLGRNDVGRVAKSGTVKVTTRNKIEFYKHVMHIVSEVEGELDEKYSPLDALIAGFPAGTVSGAPKIRAMEIINKLEADRRGVYAGCIGYFGANGAMDTAIAIRTAVIKDGIMYVQAGAGIVHDSNPQSEAEECAAKARGLLRAAEDAMREND